MYYNNLVAELFFVFAVFGGCVAILCIAAYWAIRTFVAAVGYETERAGKALKKWANE